MGRQWDNFTGPQAKAYHLLKDLDLGQRRIGAKASRPVHLRRVRRISRQFYTWVELHDDLTVSLLQARLIELNLPINVAVGTRD